MQVEDLVIGAFAAEDFVDALYHTFDFKRHLQPSKAVEKNVIKDGRGRPVTANYTIEGSHVARIDFTFTTTSDNLLTYREEVLRYALSDGGYSGGILIKVKTYDHTDPVDMELVIKEREHARASMVTELKGFIIGALQQALGYDLDQSIVAGVLFWDDHVENINKFIEFGAPAWLQALLATDLQATPHSWLAVPIDSNGTTIRDYLVSRLV